MARLDLFLLAFASLVLLPGIVLGANTKRASLTNAGGQANFASYGGSISSNGRFVAFLSHASDIVPGDTNALNDIFLRNVKTGGTTRVSVHSDGTQSDGYNAFPAVDKKGRIVVFQSSATTLVDGDTNGKSDVFVHVVASGTTTRVSIASGGAEGNGDSFNASISDDGRYVLFESAATNLVAGDTNARNDVFHHDRKTGATQRVSLDQNGQQFAVYASIPAMSQNGRFVAWESGANPSQIYVRDLKSGATSLASVDGSGNAANGSCQNCSISKNGRFVVFASGASNLVAGDTTGFGDIFLFDRKTQVTKRVSVSSSGAPGNNTSFRPRISANGKIVAFESYAANLAAGANATVTNVFVRDLKKGKTTHASIGIAGASPTHFCGDVSLSKNGRWLVFDTSSDNLVPGDTNATQDVFLRDRK